MEDLTVQCRDCPEKFVVTKAEQKSLIARFGDQYHPPKRCKPCRKKRKDKADAQPEKRTG